MASLRTIVLLLRQFPPPLCSFFPFATEPKGDASALLFTFSCVLLFFPPPPGFFPSGNLGEAGIPFTLLVFQPFFPFHFFRSSICASIPKRRAALSRRQASMAITWSPLYLLRVFRQSPFLNVSSPVGVNKLEPFSYAALCALLPIFLFLTEASNDQYA